MANLKTVYATEATTLSTELNSLASASGASSTSEVDNSSNRYIDCFFDIVLAAASATSEYCAVYLVPGSATGVLATTELTNMRFIGDVQLNGTTAVQKTIFVEAMPKYWKIRLINNSSVALAATANTVKYTGINYENI